MFEQALSFFPLAFAAMLPLVNPLGSALIIRGIVGNAPPEVYRRLAKQVAIGMVLFIGVVEVLGQWMLQFFGITLPVLQVAGGLTLAAMGWAMLNAPDVQVANTAPGKQDLDKVMDQVFYPLTFPLTVGPGVIVVVITLSAHVSGHAWESRLMEHVAILAAAILLAVLVYFCYAYAPKMQKLIPPHAASGVQRLISFILLCIGVQIAWGGLDTLLKSVLHPGA